MDGTDLYLLFVLALFRTVEVSRSARLRQSIATFAANNAYQFSPSKGEKIRAGLAAAGLNYTRTDSDNIVRGTFQTFWQDAFMLCEIDMRAELSEVRVRGFEHVRDALARGCGAILLESTYFGYRNLTKRMMHAQGWHAVQTHSVDHLGGFGSWHHTFVSARTSRPFFENHEKQFVTSLLYLSPTDFAATRQLAKLLQANGLVYISSEGQIGQKFADTNFLGRARRFATGSISLAKFSRAPVLPIFSFRDAVGELHCHIEPPLEFPNDAHAGEIGMTNYARLLDKYIRQYPDQYRSWFGVT